MTYNKKITKKAEKKTQMKSVRERKEDAEKELYIAYRFDLDNFHAGKSQRFTEKKVAKAEDRCNELGVSVKRQIEILEEAVKDAEKAELNKIKMR